jgi:outer membrane protein OmpA-like peptidoglycan-associated protein
MIDVIQEKNKIKEIAITYDKLQNELYNDLAEEFKDDLLKWNAELDQQTLSIRFKAPEVLFGQGSALLKGTFKTILSDFFPRYLEILKSEKYSNDIEEIRIEGHTSSEWRINVSKNTAYFNNMKLSQDRTRSVLQYLIFNTKNKSDVKWIKQKITANGLSSSKLICNGDESEDKQKSRRVEFRVKTNAEKRIVKILSE